MGKNQTRVLPVNSSGFVSCVVSGEIHLPNTTHKPEPSQEVLVSSTLFLTFSLLHFICYKKYGFTTSFRVFLQSTYLGLTGQLVHKSFHLFGI